MRQGRMFRRLTALVGFGLALVAGNARVAAALRDVDALKAQLKGSTDVVRGGTPA